MQVLNATAKNLENIVNRSVLEIALQPTVLIRELRALLNFMKSRSFLGLSNA